MRKLLYLILCLSAFTASAVDVVWNFADFVANSHSTRRVVITPISPWGTNASSIITGDRITYTNTTGGQLQVSNIVAGYSYRVEFYGPFAITAITNSFASDLTGYVDGKDYIGIPLLNSGVVAYSQAASDARYIRTNLIKNHLIPGSNVTFATNAAGSITISSTGGSSGSATNVFFIAGQSTTPRTIGGSNTFDVTGTITNATTGNAATATWATNLSAPFGFSEVLVSNPTNDTVESHADFTYAQSANFSTLSLGATWDLGNTSVRGGLLQLRDAAGDVNVSIGTTNGRIFFNDAIEVRDGVTHYAKVNGVHIPWFKPEQHSVAEPIYYWGGHQLAAQAWLVGSYEEGLTNGRFSFLVGELGLGWNIGRSTNSGSDVTYMTGDTTQNITNTVAWLNGPTGPELKAVMSYRRDDNRNIIGGAVRGTTIVGTNVLTAVGDNRMDVSSNYVSIGSTGKTGSIRLWDDINQLWLTIDATDGSFNFYDYGASFLFQSVDQFITVRATNVIRGEGSLINAVGITNGNVTIPGTLSVSGTTTAGTIVSPSVIGNGSGLSNAVDLIAGDSSITIVTNANKRSFTLTSTGSGGGGWTGNANQFSGGSTTNIKSGVLLTNAVNRVDDETVFVIDQAGNPVLSYDFDNEDFRVHGGLIVQAAINGHGGNITNLNASNLASGTVPTARLGSGTANSSTFLRGDNTWATPAGGSSTFNYMPRQGTNFNLTRSATKKYAYGKMIAAASLSASASGALNVMSSSGGSYSFLQATDTESPRMKTTSSGGYSGYRTGNNSLFCPTNREFAFRVTMASTNGLSATNLTKVCLFKSGSESPGDPDVTLGWQAVTTNTKGTNWVATYYNGSSQVYLHTNTATCDVMHELGIWGDGTKVVWSMDGVNVATNATPTNLSYLNGAPTVVVRSVADAASIFLQEAEIIYEVYQHSNSQQ